MTMLQYNISVQHSYGSLVIGDMAERVPKRIKHIVYLDGYIPEDNKSALAYIQITELPIILNEKTNY